MKITPSMCLCALQLVGVLCLPTLASTPKHIRSPDQSSSQDIQKAQLLEREKPIERDLPRGAIHAYEIQMEAAQYAYVRVDSPGLDTVLSLLSPDGTKILSIDEVGVWIGIPEQVHFIAEQAGRYRIEVKTTRKYRRSDRYKIRIEELRTASENDYTRVKAETLYALAVQADATKPQAQLDALKKLEEAFKLYQVIGDRTRQARSISEQGEAYFNLREKEKALEYFTKAVALWHDLGDKVSETSNTERIGAVHYNLFGNPRKGIEFAQKAAVLAREAKHPRLEAVALQFIGRAYMLFGERNKSNEFLIQSRDIARQSGWMEVEAGTLNVLATNYALLGDMKTAMDCSTRALELARRSDFIREEIYALSQIGDLHRFNGDRVQALKYFEEALRLSNTQDDTLPRIQAQVGLASLFFETGELEKSIDFNSQALILLKSYPIRTVYYEVLGNLAMAYNLTGERQKALDLYSEVLDYLHKSGPKYLEARMLNNVFAVYVGLGDYEKAMSYAKQSLAISRSLFDRPLEALALGSIGTIYVNLNDNQKAIEYLNQSRLIYQSLGDRPKESMTLSNLGRAYFVLGDSRKSLDYLEQSLAIKRSINDRIGTAVALMIIGDLYRERLNNLEKARKAFDEALRESRTSGIPYYEAVCLFDLALVERDSGNLLEARKKIESAIVILEKLRTNVVSQELRASYFASVQDFYEFYIDLLMQLHRQTPTAGFDGTALQISERARARTLLDALSDARVDIRQGADPDLIKRERSLQIQLNEKARRQMQLASSKNAIDESQRIAAELNALTGSLQEVQAQIRIKSPRYAALTQPQPLSLKEIQTSVLDAETILLEYSLGKEKSHLWAVTTTSIKSYELPKREAIETTAKRLYELLNARNHKIKDETEEQREDRIEKADRDIFSASSSLSDIVLGPVASQLGKNRLVIVADGILQYIPFAALPVPTVPTSRKNNSNQRTPLIIDHEIITLPSASTLAVIRREIEGRKPAPKTVVALADPVFLKSDSRVKGNVSKASRAEVATNSETVREVQLTDAVRDTGVASDGLNVPRLPGSRREAEQIVAMVPASQSKLALDFEANRATATNAELGLYRYVHFSTHGFLNSVHPELSGIVFSLVNENGETQDGFLRAHEVFNLKLPAELVVLSACQTGIGKEVKGEGLVSLTRGFMYAGAPRVVVSLWSVSEMGTTELMVRFYREMLKKGLRPSAALRAAQISLSKDKRFNSPFYWAPFILQGEWR